MFDNLSFNKNLKSSKSKFLLIAGFLSILGIFLGTYATFHHMEVKSHGSTEAACNINSQVSCDKVAKSAYSEFLTYPLGVWGVSFFLGLLILTLLSSFSVISFSSYYTSYFVLAIIGVLVSLILAGISFFSLSSLCLVCLGVYLVSLLQLALTLYTMKIFTPLSLSFSSGLNFLIPLLALVLSFILFDFVYPKESNKLNLDLKSPRFSSETYDIPIVTSRFAPSGEDYVLGSKSAKVTIVEFADFQCSACKRAGENLKNIQNEFGEQVQLVFKNYPLDQQCNSAVRRKFHQMACEIAFYARCAGTYGKFWLFHDLAFSNQRNSNKKTVTTWLKNIGISDEQIKSCRNNENYNKKLIEDIALANDLGVQSTPTIFVNGRRYFGSIGSDLREDVKKLLQQKF
ncbi:MAG: hypothetical protein CMP11_07365 [Zetaproteobacteria bacterium]|nr:hypothetical protein [Pseudobdellovibrionaceae bacterium]|tara:strand:- start:34 stop:1233 length:1200 start_codon:yes stop_codon:yes gene_type:complete